MNRFIFRFAPLACLLELIIAPVPALAQLDPLLFLKPPSNGGSLLTTAPTLAPNVILAVDTSERMQRDIEETYYDPGTYTRTHELYEMTLGLELLDPSAKYRRKYLQFEHREGTDKFLARHIDAVGDVQSSFATFYEPTRLAMVRRALLHAIAGNKTSSRFALIKTRQLMPTLGAAGDNGPTVVSDPAQQSPSDMPANRWAVTRTSVAAKNSTHTAPGLVTSATAAGANATILATLGKNIGTAGALLPAGQDTFNAIDSPVGLMLDDAKSHASSLITADIAANNCRNTIVVLLVGGGEGTIFPQNLKTKAATFRDINGRRVPIYVVALFPPAADVDSLKDVAAESGGQYVEITKDMLTDLVPGDPVLEAVRAVHTAIQHAFVPAETFNTAPTPELPFGPYAEMPVTSPIVGTVNLKGATYLTATGTATLPDSETEIFTTSSETPAEIPQRSNVLVTTGFQLPGFEATIRAFRVYKPVPDSTKPSGFRFTQDGTRLWVATTPAAGSRNIYTVLPGSSTLVPFNVSHVGSLDNHLGVSNPSALIEYVRGLPLGAVVSSTPAFLDPPSLDPPPDPDYPAFREAHKDRRALIFVGSNGGMLHAIDARSGLEVWAFIPFNLLPKLKTLRFGQPIDAFNYFVDSSPKIADVKVAGAWRTCLFFGQGAGGTFYNTLDVTLAGIDDVVEEASTSESALLTYFADGSRIPWKWSFPRNSSFDSTLAPYGELSATNASAIEMTVGETWSDPAIGQVQNEDGPFVMVTGSGFLKHSVQNAHRASVARAGTTFYVLDVATGAVLDTPRDVGADTFAETTDDCRIANDCTKMKNALQMDPVATGPSDQRFITKVYIGDLDGRVWKFALSASGATVNVSEPIKLHEGDPNFPLFSSMATVAVGGTNQYIFVGTGSDLLPSNGVNQSYSLLVLLDNGSSATKTGEILLERTDWPITTGGDEKVTAFPAVAGDIVFFTTTTYKYSTPCTLFGASLYAFTFIGGPAYDTNNDGSLSAGSGSGKGKGGGGSGSTSGDSQKVFSTSTARATAPFIVDQHLAFATGGTIQMFGDPDDFNNGVGQAGVRILSWRTVR